MAVLSLRLTIAYDGTHYLGWQQTGEGPSIQGTLRRCAQQILQAPVEVEAASRTDAGVHALGQVVSLRCLSSRYDIARFLCSLKRLLPSDIAIVTAQPVSLEFHPTLQARGKTYWYWVSPRSMPLERHRVWQLPEKAGRPVDLDLGAMRRAASWLIGRHDFSAFAVDHIEMPIKDPFCELMSIEIEEIENGLIRLCVQGDRFLYKMCRSLAGTLVDCGRGRIDPDALPEILASRRRERAGVCAPAHGLTLFKVHYSAEA